MQKKQRVQTLFSDNPAILETFADTVRSFSFDGQTVRIEFCTTRLGKPTPPDPPTATQHPTCRLVLPPTAAIDLFNKLQKLMSALEQSGAVKREATPPENIQ